MKTVTGVFGRMIGPERNKGLITFVPNDNPDMGSRVTLPTDTYKYLGEPAVILTTVEAIV